MPQGLAFPHALRWRLLTGMLGGTFKPLEVFASELTVHFSSVLLARIDICGEESLKRPLDVVCEKLIYCRNGKKTPKHAHRTGPCAVSRRILPILKKIFPAC